MSATRIPGRTEPRRHGCQHFEGAKFYPSHSCVRCFLRNVLPRYSKTATDMATDADLYSCVHDLFNGSRSTTLRDVEAVLETGVSPNVWRGPSSPLKCAVQMRHTRLLDLLVRNGADANYKDSRHVTPLHIATFDGKADCVRILLRARADTNLKDRHGQTPLFFAPSRQICELLLSARADANVTNKKQQTPLHMAAHAGLVDAWCCIEKATNKRTMELKDHRGFTPLHYAAASPIKSTALATLRLHRPPSSKSAARTTVEPLPPLIENRANLCDGGVAEGHVSGNDETDAGVARLSSAQRSSRAGWMRPGALEGARHHGIMQKDIDGCLHWEVQLVKKTREDRYGFVQANGRTDFESWLSAGYVTKDMEDGGLQGHAGPEMEHSPLPGPEVLIVRRIHDGGLVWGWNQVHQEAAICPQDRICSVNGHRRVETMQREFRNADTVVMKMLRYPERFSVMLSISGPAERLGFRFERPAKGSQRSEVLITEIMEDGLIAVHNRKQVAAGKWHYVVMPMMLIEKANDAMGNACLIADELRRKTPQVLLSIWRAEQAILLSKQARATNVKGAIQSGEGRKRN